ncbi:MAG: hypothetical protein KDB02_04550 [Acidimicrobiales bacterium]|nr:hypothetical protein [Acidimicrobiales bacterium]
MSSPLDRELQELTDRTRAENAASARRHQRSLLSQASEEGTFRGVLVDLAERQVSVAVHTSAGRILQGTIRALGSDYVGLIGTRDDPTLVPLRSVTGLRPEPGTRPTVGDRSQRWASSWNAALVDLVADRPLVSLHTSGGDRIQGRLWTVGQDVVAVRLQPGVSSYVPIEAINDLALT